MKLLIPSIAILLALVWACTDGDTRTHESHELPILGERDVVGGDTVYHTVGDWSFYRQDSALVTEDMLQGTPYVVDFFFTSCPTICPKVTANMLRVRERFQVGPDADARLKLVSFTVDPKRDSVGHLARYSQNLGITDVDDWWFLTGDKLELFDIADDYFSVAVEDPGVPGGFDHSGRILLVDERGRVRAYADGTDDEEVNEFMQHVEDYLKRSARANG